MPSGGLYNPYHRLGEPETAIELNVGKYTSPMDAMVSYWSPSETLKKIYLRTLKTANSKIWCSPGTPRPSIYKWLFQLDDSQSLHRKWLEITKHQFFNGWPWGSRQISWDILISNLLIHTPWDPPNPRCAFFETWGNRSKSLPELCRNLYHGNLRVPTPPMPSPPENKALIRPY